MLKSPPKALHSLLFTVIAFVLFTGCSHTDPDAPAETQRDTLLSPPVSVLAVPVHYKMSELEAMVNEKLKGSFIRKHIPISKREDSLYIEVSRRGGITLRRDGHTLYYTVPLRIKGTYKAKVAGIRITNSKPVEADVTLDLATFLSLDERWELVTRSEVKAIHWVNDPVLDLGVLKLNLRHPLEKMLTEKEGELMNIADRSLDKLIDTRKIVKKLWMDLQKPILVNKKKKNVWIKAYGVDLAGVLENDDPEILSLRVQLKALVQTMVDKDQEKPSNPVLPAFKRPENQNDSLLVYLHAVIPFKEVNEFLEGEFRNKELAAKGFATRIKNIRMYGTDKGIAVELKVKGDVDGVLYAEGVPVYDPVKRVIALKDFGFSVHSENMLLNSADWLLHSDALDALNGKLEYQVDQLVGKLPDLISQGIEKGKSGNKVNVNIARLQVAPYTIITTKSNIQIILAASGKADIELEKQVFSGKKKRQ